MPECARRIVQNEEGMRKREVVFVEVFFVILSQESFEDDSSFVVLTFSHQRDGIGKAERGILLFVIFFRDRFT